MPEADKTLPGVPLAKMIGDLRGELLEALAEGKDKELRFKLQPVELELAVAVTWKGEANAGVKFWVLDFGAKGGAERATTHRLKLTLKPVDRSGGEFFVSDHSLPD